MRCMNIHNHKIDYIVWDNNAWSNNFELQTNYFTNFINRNSNILCAIICRNCNELYYDYPSNFRFNNNNENFSLFCNRFMIGNYKINGAFIFEFYEFNDCILIGTKNEIISFINQKFNSLEKDYNSLNWKMNSTNAQNSKLTKDLSIKENEIEKVKETLNKEKNINQNITLDLNLEKEKNRKLKNSLDNIAYKNNENVSKILQQLDNEKKLTKDLQTKYSELEKQEQIKSKNNEDLKSQLKDKEKELKNKINYGLKFQSDCSTGEYDIILDINSIISLIKDGWKVTYNNKEDYLQKINQPTVVVGVIGNKNAGKTFFLEKLSGYTIPNGFNVKTIGLSVRYGTTPDHNVAILDSAGQETPLLKMEASKIGEKKIELKDENENDEKENQNGIPENANDEKQETKESKKKNEDNENEKDNEFEEYSRDKLITEFFLQKFIIWKSDIIILVVGNISLTEQKLLYTVKQQLKNLNGKKEIFVIHNLKEYSKKEQVDDYIENTLKKLCKIDLEETDMLTISNNSKGNKEFFKKYFVEKNDKNDEGPIVSHFILINEFSDICDIYNTPTINFIQKEIEVVKYKNKFSLIDECKEFLVNIADKIMEENIKKENLKIEEGEKFDKIVLKGVEQINLISYAVNEVGFTFRNDNNEPKYSCYYELEVDEPKLYIHIELPGGGRNIKKNYEVKGGFNILTFEGEKFGDKELEEDEKNGKKKFKKICNKRKTNKFKFHVEIPNGQIQIMPENLNKPHQAGKFVNNEDSNGILTVVYKIFVYNQKANKNDDNDGFDFFTKKK